MGLSTHMRIQYAKGLLPPSHWKHTPLPFAINVVRLQVASWVTWAGPIESHEAPKREAKCESYDFRLVYSEISDNKLSTLNH